MRDPASKKDSRSRARQVSRQELLRTSGHIVANVIDRHQHHDGPTQSIHRLNARRRHRLGGNRGSSHDFAILFSMQASGCRFLKKTPPVGVQNSARSNYAGSLRWWRSTRTRTGVTGPDCRQPLPYRITEGLPVIRPKCGLTKSVESAIAYKRESVTRAAIAAKTKTQVSPAIESPER
jgi:hypothetical protein